MAEKSVTAKIKCHQAVPQTFSLTHTNNHSKHIQTDPLIG